MIQIIPPKTKTQAAIAQIWPFLRKGPREKGGRTSWVRYRLGLLVPRGGRAKGVRARAFNKKGYVNALFPRRRHVTREIQLPPRGFHGTLARQRRNIISAEFPRLPAILTGKSAAERTPPKWPSPDLSRALAGQVSAREKPRRSRTLLRQSGHF